ncbi:hypothetical protein FXO38_00167 [Capsicum annuum]|nr:hypothetical protein FXO38_00167 [Capsicum annuum]KAF3685574.1 hypothetical protein FXO37_00483 [Capsicum annuum]
MTALCNLEIAKAKTLNETSIQRIKDARASYVEWNAYSLVKEICSQDLKDKSGFMTWFPQVDNSRVGKLVTVNAPQLNQSIRHFPKDVLGKNGGGKGGPVTASGSSPVMTTKAARLGVLAVVVVATVGGADGLVAFRWRRNRGSGGKRSGSAAQRRKGWWRSNGGLLSLRLVLLLRGGAGSPQERDNGEKEEAREAAPLLMLPLMAGTSTNHGDR